MRRVAVIIYVLVATLILGSEASAHVPYPYLGSGKWSTSSLYYYSYATGDYATYASQVANDYTVLTDVNISATAEGYEKIGVFTGNWGATNWDGRTYICTTSSCPDGVPIDATYSYAEIDLNTYWMNAYLGWVKKAVIAHEFGHTLSLAHVGTCDGLHIMYTPVQSSCNKSISVPQSHDIAGVNARY